MRNVLAVTGLVIYLSAQTTLAATPVYNAPLNLPIASKPTWNIPDMQAKPVPFVTPKTVLPRYLRNTSNQNASPSEGLGFLALPVSQSKAIANSQNALVNSYKKLEGPQAPETYPLAINPKASNQLDPNTEIGVLALPLQTERLFVDMDNLIARELIDSLRNPQVKLLDSNNPQIQDWLETYNQTHQGLVNTPLPRQLLLVQTTVDSHNTRQPSTLNGWVKWLASDTLPNTLQYRLVTHARLLDTTTGQLIWQNTQQTTLPNQQLTSLSRLSNKVAGNQLALGQSAKTLGDKLARQYLLFTGQKPQYWGQQTLSTLKALPGLTVKQLMP